MHLVMVVSLLTACLFAISPNPALAGSFTVTTTPEQDATLAALKQTPQQIVDNRLKGAAMAEENRKLGQLRQACQKGDKAACAAIQTATRTVK